MLLGDQFSTRTSVMTTITTEDGPEIYQEWGERPALTQSRGWPLSSDVWDDQMTFLAHNGFRAMDRDPRSRPYQAALLGLPVECLQ
jgi:hypothetical protein